MKFDLRFFLVILIGLNACTDSVKKETQIEQEQPIDTDTAKKVVIPQLKTDYPDRVYVFKKTPDSTIEQQVQKYEQFSVLFIEYVGIYKNQPLYSYQDQEDNTEAYNILRDELASLKTKIRKKQSTMTKSQEKRLDVADEKMNKFLPESYK